MSRQTLFGALLSQNLCVLVVSDTTDVPHRVGRENVLGTPSRVLRCSAGDELCMAVLDQVVVEAHLVGLSQKGVVEFEPVFLEHFLVAGHVNGGPSSQMHLVSSAYPCPWISSKGFSKQSSLNFLSAILIETSEKERIIPGRLRTKWDPKSVFCLELPVHERPLTFRGMV